MFHSETPENKKEKIVSALQNIDSCVDIMFATSALGMGVGEKITITNRRKRSRGMVRV